MNDKPKILSREQLAAISIGNHKVETYQAIADLLDHILAANMDPCPACRYIAWNARVWESKGAKFCVVCDLRERLNDSLACEKGLAAALKNEQESTRRRMAAYTFDNKPMTCGPCVNCGRGMADHIQDADKPDMMLCKFGPMSDMEKYEVKP